jgi:hypothetical protein
MMAATAAIMLSLRAAAGIDTRGRAVALIASSVCAIGLLVTQERELGRSFLRRRPA